MFLGWTPELENRKSVDSAMALVMALDPSLSSSTNGIHESK